MTSQRAHSKPRQQASQTAQARRSASAGPATKRAAALMLALAMLGLSACSEGQSDAGTGGDPASDTTYQAESDSEATFVDGDAAEDATRSEGAVAMESAEYDGAAPDSEAESASPPQGFFPDESSEDPEENPEDDNTFDDYGIRQFIATSLDPLSTFALDVDTASYSIGQRWLSEGVMPPQESVRVEEYVNSFDYDYQAPGSGLNVVAEGAPSPFQAAGPDGDRVILRLGVQAEVVANDDRPAANLTFVVDTSGSMNREDRLGLVKESLSTLVRELSDDDSIAIVTYSDGADVVLAPTSVRDADVILDAIDRLGPGGSTNLEAGLREGYNLADEAFDDGSINRVILASDGVANVGLTDPDGLVSMIRDDADRGIQLVTLGVGMGNFNDVVMETLADDGDGFYAYVNTASEADELFGDELVGTLLTVAIDGKIQVEFDEETVSSYRLLGYENRAVLDDDFRNDEVDAGELGAGHQVTAIYELIVEDSLRSSDRLGTASLRWEDPESGDVIETRLELSAGIIEDRWSDASDDLRLAVTVGSLAEVLRGSPYAEGLSFDQIAAEVEALQSSGSANNADLADLLDMIEQADSLS